VSDLNSENLSRREIEVLHALIDCYIKTAQPVGSRRLANKYRLGISPATIRNTLQDLEDRGLTYQPHTSAGRIPTEQAYKIYVQSLIEIQPLNDTEKAIIKSQLTTGSMAIDQILEQACRLLSNISSQLGVSVAPRFTEGILTRLELIPVAETKLLLVIAIKSGIVKSVVMEVETSINPKMVEETSAILNERLVGLKLGRIIETIHERFRDVSYGDARLLRLFVDSADKLLTTQEEKDIHIVGTPNIASQPEFQNPRKISELVSFLEERKNIIQVLNSIALSDGVVVTIGKEANLGNLDSCSLVTSTYSAGKSTGTIGVIGPTRMQYSKLMSIVDYTSKVISEILSKE
jgi:heat-inducible transcriptional repressor